MNRYVCPVCGGGSYSAASPDTLKDNKCLDPECDGRVEMEGVDER